ncbi:MAG: NAD(P)-dependent oxidoreductase [Candidatus Diapherotrites archaeon]|nr:NAD(P)-dependent oxidoreductase [Candidatus Diapherotrites archaeon]
MELSFSSALITGSTGFIGQALKARLLNENIHVISVDRQPEKGENCFEGCITDLDSIKEYFFDVDVVFHLAAVSHPKITELNPSLSELVNVTGTRNVLQACVDGGVKKVFFPSSAYVYGAGAVGALSESRELNPNSFYGVHKVFGEYYCKLFFEKFGLDCRVGRFFNVFGPGQTERVIPDLIRKALNDDVIEVLGSGNAGRDFIWIDDALDAVFSILENGAGGEVYNIGTGKSTTVNELVEIIKSVLDCDKDVVHTEIEQKTQDFNNYADISKLKETGFEVKTEFKEAVEKLCTINN